jgi:hypothetical protein
MVRNYRQLTVQKRADDRKILLVNSNINVWVDMMYRLKMSQLKHLGMYHS